MADPRGEDVGLIGGRLVGVIVATVRGLGAAGIVGVATPSFASQASLIQSDSDVLAVFAAFR